MQASNTYRIAGVDNTRSFPRNIDKKHTPFTDLLFGKAVKAFQQKSNFAHSNQGDVFVKSSQPAFKAKAQEPSSFAEWYYSPEVYDNCFLNIDS